MKKFLSIFISIMIIVGVFSAIPASAATQSVVFGQQYSYNYTDKNCTGTFFVPSNGMVELNIIEMPKSKYGYECSLELTVKSGSKEIVSNEYIYDAGSYYMFLDQGSYSFNFYMDNSTLPVTPLVYSFNFISNYNNYTRSIKFGTSYKHYYSSENCYNSFSLSQASTVKFTLSQPIEEKTKQAVSSYIYIYDMNHGGKQIANYSYSSYNPYSYTYTVRLSKGSYKFNYCTYFYENSNHFYDYDDIISSTYKVTITPATAPSAPKITHTVKVTKSGSYRYYNVDAKFTDKPNYDGVELWIKKNNGAWQCTDTGKNSEYARYTKVNIYFSSASDYLVFYKVRAYTLYGNEKKYSNFSNVLYTKTSLKPATPTVSVKTAKKAAKIIWKKVSGANGYIIYRSTSKNKGFKKIATIKKSTTKSYTNKKLKSKKTYYYKVRAFKKVSNVTIYSNYSTPKKVKIK